jgi:hypothetical protein
MKRILVIAVMLGLIAAIVPTATFAWSVGDTQTNVNSFNLSIVDGSTVPDVGPITDQWDWTVNALGTTPGLGAHAVALGWAPWPGTCFQQTATIAPLDYAWTGGWPTTGACREAYTSSAGATTVADVLSGGTLDSDDLTSQAVQSVSTQALFGGFAFNTATIDYQYVGFPTMPFTVITATTLSMGTSYTDTFAVYAIGGGLYAVPGCGNIPTVTMNWDWVATTSLGIPLPTFPVMGAMVMDVANCPGVPTLPGGGLQPFQMVDNYHYISTESSQIQTAVPCPCVPETATIALMGLGLVVLAGFVVFKRRRVLACMG